MALGTPATQAQEQGQTTMRPNGMLRMSFAGDTSYPTGGTLNFGATYLLAETGRPLDVTAVIGHGFTAGALSHFVQYDVATDALKVYLLAGAEVTAATDLSTVTFDVVVVYQ